MLRDMEEGFPMRRECPRCAASVLGERVDDDEGVTVVWRCRCGWAGARTAGDVGRPVSGVSDRRAVLAGIAGAERKRSSG
jgi:hypothetical protein